MTETTTPGVPAAPGSTRSAGALFRPARERALENTLHSFHHPDCSKQ